MSLNKEQLHQQDQEILDTVYRELTLQRAYSINEDGSMCQYQSLDEDDVPLHCAIGHLMPQVVLECDELMEDIEGSTIDYTLIRIRADGPDEESRQWAKRMAQSTELLIHLQSLHDLNGNMSGMPFDFGTADVNGPWDQAVFNRGIAKVADAFNLTCPQLED